MMFALFSCLLLLHWKVVIFLNIQHRNQYGFWRQRNCHEIFLHEDKIKDSDEECRVLLLCLM